MKSSDFVESFDLSPGKSIYTDLIKKGFYVRNDLDEFKILNHNANIEIYGSDTFELTIIPTDACNFSCQYCYQDGQPHIMNDYGSLFNYIKFTLKKVKLLIINWFGGEPLICGQNIVEFMKKVKQECKSNNVLLYSTITTNGSLLSYDLFCELTKVGIFYYQITLDGLEKQITVSDIWRIHKSFLVNAIYVKTIRRYGVNLTTGNILSVSQAKYNVVQQKYTEYNHKICK